MEAFRNISCLNVSLAFMPLFFASQKHFRCFYVVKKYSIPGEIPNTFIG